MNFILQSWGCTLKLQNEHKGIGARRISDLRGTAQRARRRGAPEFSRDREESHKLSEKEFFRGYCRVASMLLLLPPNVGKWHCTVLGSPSALGTFQFALQISRFRRISRGTCRSRSLLTVSQFHRKTTTLVSITGEEGSSRRLRT